MRGLHQRFKSARIEPGHATSQRFNAQATCRKVGTVDIGDFQLAARGWFQVCGHVDYIVIVEIQPGDRMPRARLLRFFHDVDNFSGTIEFHHAITLRILHGIREDRGISRLPRRSLQFYRDIMAIKYIIPQDQHAVVITDKFTPQDECLRQALGSGLDPVLYIQAPLLTITQ